MSLPSLLPQQSDGLNRPLTLQEVQTVIRSSKLLKSPGPDGLPNEYYRTFLDILASHLQKVCQSFFTSLPPPVEMLQATISTIPKPGKPLDDPANFQPISLLNSDVKLFSKILANRINLLLPSLVSPDQVGFIPHKQARDGTRRVLDLIQSAHISKDDSALISLDAEKVFDHINWLYLHKVLHKFGFSGPIFSAITSLYT